MTAKIITGGIGRRTLLKTGLAAGAVGVTQIASPFVLRARADDAIKIGFNTPLTGTYAAVGKNEQIGAEYALAEINAKGGVLGRPMQLLVEDSTSGDVGTAVQKTRKLIERDKVDFILGNVNSSISLAMGQVCNELKTLQIVTGGHTDAITGKNCLWNVFRVCNTTQMEASAVAGTIIETAGKKWYYITPDYSFGHTLQGGLEKAASALGGSKVGEDLTPLGTTDFSSYLIKAQSAAPDVVIFTQQGDDGVNIMKQAVQFGLDKQLHIAGAQMELEVLLGLPPEARVGTWVFEWYWNQPGVAHVAEFVAGIRKKTGKVPTARNWFGYTAVWTCALAATKAGVIDAGKMAKALEGFELPPEIALMPNPAAYRAGDHQLIASLFVGNAQANGASDPEDLFKVTKTVKGADVAAGPEANGCKMVWPS